MKTIRELENSLQVLRNKARKLEIEISNLTAKSGGIYEAYYINMMGEKRTENCDSYDQGERFLNSIKMQGLKKPGSEYGVRCIRPNVGDGATRLGIDKYPYTVISVTDKAVTVQRDHQVRTDKNGMSQCQEYSFSPNPNGEKVVIKKIKGRWTAKGNNVFAVGYRRAYYSFEF